MKKVSIIIPIYNAEQSIQNTIESCLRQTLDSIEIICINDGSTDGTEKVLEHYRENERVVIVCQENKGTGAARNSGLRRANGEFVFFLDSDDCFPDDDVLQTLYYEAKRNKVKICGGNAVIERHGKILECEKEHPTYRHFVCPKTGLCDYLDTQFFVGFTRFIYQTDFIVENNIFFPEITEYEDPFFLVQAFYYARYYFVIDKNVYQIHRGEHIRTYDNDKKVREALIGIGKILEFAQSMKLSKLQSVILEDTYNTRFNIFMYPFKNNVKELISLERRIAQFIDYELLKIEGRERLFDLFQEKRILDEINKVVEVQNKLDIILKHEKEVYIFGAGNIAERVYQYMIRSNIYVKGFVVSSMNGNPSRLHDVEVLTIESKSIDLRNMVIVALASTEGIKQKLEMLGYKNILILDFSKLRLII